jgi:hypothetical protein
VSNINVNFSTSTGRGLPSGAGQAGSGENVGAGKTPSQTPQATPQVNFQSTTMNLLTERMMSTINIMNIMEAKEFAFLIRDLLSMPKDLQNLLALLAFGKDNGADIAQLLKNMNANILAKDLQQLLGNNSKEVINKLIQLTQNNALFFEGSNQLRDILGFVQKISVTSQQSPSDALTNVMLLYLPWLPLTQQKQLELYFGYEESDSGEGTDIEVLVMFIRTENIGTFKVTIILNPDKTLEIDIENDQVASSVIDNIVAETKGDLQESGLLNKISTRTRKNTETRSPKEMKKETTKSISIHPSGKISVITVHTGYKIASIIFTIDEKQSLLKIREEKIK